MTLTQHQVISFGFVANAQIVAVVIGCIYIVVSIFEHIKSFVQTIGILFILKNRIKF